MTTISIIIPAFNEEKYILSTLQSIKEQTIPDYEVIVVTNGCTDKTVELVQQQCNDKIKHFNLPIANVSRARNYGAGKASGSILLFLDADTLLAPESLEMVSETFRNGHAVATTKVRPDSPQLKYKTAMWFKNFYNSTGLYQGCSGALICRKDHFDQVNGYNSKLVVKEHRKLILNLKELGSYTCINTYVTTSMRRFQRWGLSKGVYFWTKQWIKDKVGGLEKSQYEKVR